VAPLRLALLDEILSRHLQRGFDRFRAAADQIDMSDAFRRIGDETIRKLLGHVGGKEARMGIGDLVELGVERLEHVGMTVAQAGDGRPA
jgi:hypothetical protein